MKYVRNKDQWSVCEKTQVSRYLVVNTMYFMYLMLLPSLLPCLCKFSTFWVCRTTAINDEQVVTSLSSKEALHICTNLSPLVKPRQPFLERLIPLLFLRALSLFLLSLLLLPPVSWSLLLWLVVCQVFGRPMSLTGGNNLGFGH